MTHDTTQPGIDWLKTVGGALAAVSTAVLLSTLGAAGTLIGAALGSVAITVTTQLYTQGLARSRATMARAQEVALTKVGVAQAEVRRAGRRRGDDRAVEAHLDRAEETLGEARSELDEGAAPTPTLRDRLVLLPWKRIALLAVATFVVVLVAIGVFEKVAGRSVASYTGGSGRDTGSIVPGNGGQGGQEPGNEERRNGDRPSNDPSATRDDKPSASPSAEPPADSSTPTPSPTPTPEASTSPTPTPAPTSTPSRAPIPVPTR